MDDSQKEITEAEKPIQIAPPVLAVPDHAQTMAESLSRAQATVESKVKEGLGAKVLVLMEKFLGLITGFKRQKVLMGGDESAIEDTLSRQAENFSTDAEVNAVLSRRLAENSDFKDLMAV